MHFFSKERRLRMWMAEYFFFASALQLAALSALAWLLMPAFLWVLAASAENANEPAMTAAATVVIRYFMETSLAKHAG
jgi:hypothetical protein